MTNEPKAPVLKERLDMLSEGANPGPYTTESYGSGTTYLILGQWVGHYADDLVPMMGGGRAEIVNSNVPSAWGKSCKKGHTAAFLAELANAYRAGRLITTDALTAEVQRLRAILQEVDERSFRTYRARNGRECMIQADDGEACEIVHSEAMFLVRAALSETPLLTSSRHSAIAEIAAERQRQIEAEGWTPEHDDKHAACQMALAAGCYAMYASAPEAHRAASDMPGSLNVLGRPLKGWAAWLQLWPWDRKWWKPTTPRRDLVKAGALILAEIERLDRAALRAAQEGGDA